MAHLSGLRPAVRRCTDSAFVGCCRRHVPLTLYAIGSLSFMGWVAWTLLRLP